MNGAINFSTDDGWIPEFAKHGVNSFVVPPADLSRPIDEQDLHDYKHLMQILEDEIVPLYYEKPEEWMAIVKNSMRDVYPFFESGRMADEYYQRLYNS